MGLGRSCALSCQRRGLSHFCPRICWGLCLLTVSPGRSPPEQDPASLMVTRLSPHSLHLRVPMGRPGTSDVYRPKAFPGFGAACGRQLLVVCKTLRFQRSSPQRNVKPFSGSGL